MIIPFHNETVDLAGRADSPDLECILAQRKTKVHVSERREKFWDYISMGSNISDVLKHTNWYHTRRSAAPHRKRP